MPRGRPYASWLRQVETYLKDMDVASPAATVRRRPEESRRKVDAPTGCSGDCSHT